MTDPVEFVDQLPDAARGRTATIKADILTQLRANPGQWAIVRRWNDGKPHNTTSWITKGNPDIEAHQRVIDGENRLYARALA